MRHEIEHRGPREAACPDTSALARKGQRPVIAQQRCGTVDVELPGAEATEVLGLTDGSEGAVLDESSRGSVVNLSNREHPVSARQRRAEE